MHRVASLQVKLAFAQDWGQGLNNSLRGLRGCGAVGRGGSKSRTGKSVAERHDYVYDEETQERKRKKVDLSFMQCMMAHDHHMLSNSPVAAGSGMHC
jgi:hypothetical protein